jgi:uncharacterized membrane-anchored protein
MSQYANELRPRNPIGKVPQVTLAFWIVKILVKSSLLFWIAYILTRPLGATLGDTLTKSHAEGGFAIDRINASLVILALMAIGIILTSRRSRQIANPREGA